MAQRCGSIGGCEYRARLDEPDATHDFEFDHGVVGVGNDISLAAPIARSPGAYRLTYIITQNFSDSIENGVRQLGPVSSCTTDFEVTAEVGSIVADGAFTFDGCEVHIVGQGTGGGAPATFH